MTDRRPSWEDINAYVDGELDAVDSARVARAIADDAETARAVAAIAQLKASAAEIADDAPELSLARPRRTPWRAIAASLAALAVAGGASLYALAPGADEPVWLAAARAPHQSWTNEPTVDNARPTAGVFLAAVRRLGPATYVPDLTAAKLRVARVEFRPASARSAAGIHVGYVGTRGCRISLWITPAAGTGIDETLSRRYDEGDTVYSWRTGEIGYVMLSSGMDPGRFALVARAAREATQVRARLDAEMRSALRESRRASPPCAA